MNLNKLYIGSNNLIELHPNIFHNNTELEKVYMDYCDLTALPGDLFHNNLKLQKINLKNNKLEFIGLNLLYNLNYLKDVNLQKNLCINKYFPSEIEIDALCIEIKDNCNTIKEWNGLKVQVKTLENSVYLKSNEISKLQSEKSELYEQISDYKEINQELEEKNEEKAEVVLKLENEFENCNESVQQLVDEINELKEILSYIKSSNKLTNDAHKEMCENCTDKMTYLEAEIEKIKKRKTPTIICAYEEKEDYNCKVEK